MNLKYRISNMELVCCLFVLTFLPPFVNASAKPSLETIDRDIQILNPRDFGAKGDGVTDDTEAFNKLDAAIDKVSGPVHVHIPAGTFMANPLKTPVRMIGPGIFRQKCLIQLRKDHSKLTCSGVIKILKGPDYAKGKGLKNGHEWYWSVVNIRANYCTVDGLNFDGNGTGTYTGWISKQPNLRWEGVSAFGEGNHTGSHVGNKVINCTIIGGGGQAVGFQYQKQAIIANNIFQDSSGAGFSKCEDSILTGNTAIRSHDAPYVVNGKCNNIIVSNNVSRFTTNGSGIDVVGCDNVLIKGNVIEESAAWGLLIGYSAQQKSGGKRIMVTGNLFVNNCRSTDTPMNGEICIGRPWMPTDDVAIDVTVSGNKFTVDGTHGNFKGNFISIAYGAKDIQIIDNVISGKPNKQNAIMTVWAPADDISVIRNIWTGKTSLKVIKKASVKGRFEISDNKRIIAGD